MSTEVIRFLSANFRRYASLLTLCFLGFSPPAFSWGDEGHRITGYIASALLSDAAREKIKALIGTDELSQVATYLDDQRVELEARIPESSKWHYENREVCGRNAGTAQCPSGNCITHQIDKFIRELKDRRANNRERAEAIRVLVHLLGDLHQPLHLADNHDRGGNDVFVWLPREREPRHLHEAWDTQFVRWNVNRRDDFVYARSLLKKFSARRSEWQRGSIASWADETYGLGKELAYDNLPGFSCGLHNTSTTTSLTPTYVSKAREIVAEQVAKAGMRIAFVLNDALN